ncbi:MAG: hypothetical protein ACPKPY_11420, partial [Nitrososphaeraceae archaeon]
MLKLEIWSILLFATVLLIPATSLTYAQQYNDVYYDDDRYYYDNNEYIYEEYYYPPKDKKMKEPPMLLVKKGVLFCDDIANGNDITCVVEPDSILFPGPDSGRYV